MDTQLLARQPIDITRNHTGVVIPVYLAGGIDRSYGIVLLEDTVHAYCSVLGDPTRICLSVDGAACGAEEAAEIADACGASVHVSERNMGKLGAAQRGVRVLLARPEVSYVAIVDQDGDHFANELLNLVRVAEHIRKHTDHRQVLVLGQRVSRHRPMGFLRGELEEVADRVLLDALAYRAAMTGRPLRLEYAACMGEFPDFHSGYKLFDRVTAERVFLGEPHKASVPDTCYYRHAVEAVMVVEALEAGAYLGTVNRTTINEQPISTFGRYNLSQLVADKMIWPCKRLGVPLVFVEQWLANHVQRVLLHTLRPDGVEEVERIRQLVTAAYDPARQPDPLLQPLFV